MFHLRDEALGFWIDARRMGLAPQDLENPAVAGALVHLEELEGGGIANPDEGRRVGHFWLRDAALAPDGLGDVIEACRLRVVEFAAGIRSEGRFDTVLQVGIGGSALGPQLLSDALPGEGLDLAFLDNTDPEGIDRVLGGLDLGRTLVLVVSKSGGTRETRNGMLEVRAACERAGLEFAERAVAVTCEDSQLDRLAAREGWIARFPLWDWVGGRFSVTSAVGLLPAALAGRDIDGLLAGAFAMDRWGRAPAARNPAVLLAASWLEATEGRALRSMVVLPYRDRLVLWPRYLQQLIMESLGKRLDLQGRVVHQGLTVYGNKGSTDQHAYVQQLREGPDDHFICFVASLQSGRASPDIEVEPGITTADYLRGFFLGTRRAVSEAGRKNLSLVLDRLDARSLGALIALHERAVGLYAAMVGINAYHQPGVEAGQVAAGEVLALQARLADGEDCDGHPMDDVELLRAALEDQRR